MKIDKVYALAVNPPEPIFFYVGIATDPGKRFKKHLADIANGSAISSKRNPSGVKSAYEWVRHHPKRSTLFMEILDEEGLCTEEWWRAELIALGQPIQNDNHGNRQKRKWRSTVEPFRVPKDWKPNPECVLLLQEQYGTGKVWSFEPSDTSTETYAERGIRESTNVVK